MRSLTLIAGILLVVVIAAGGAIALVSRDRGQGVVPDKVQSAAGEAVRNRGSAAPVPQARCPAELAGCKEVGGSIVYVEAVDPDGDGDAHFVLADSSSVTGPGVTVVDVRVGLRPHPLPGVGERLTAAGTPETGSHGQTQIEAVALESG